MPAWLFAISSLMCEVQGSLQGTLGAHHRWNWARPSYRSKGTWAHSLGRPRGVGKEGGGSWIWTVIGWLVLLLYLCLPSWACCCPGYQRVHGHSSQPLGQCQRLGQLLAKLRQGSFSCLQLSYPTGPFSSSSDNPPPAPTVSAIKVFQAFFPLVEPRVMQASKTEQVNICQQPLA